MAEHDAQKDSYVAEWSASATIPSVAMQAISDAAIDIADGRGTSRSTIGWNRQRALAERILSRIYLTGWNDALRSS
ncbi:hypothetical protein FHS82_000824 [Pseudochelatococcus lubricantis]|uniref:Uncharacterized protein n=1 Tax=Pseudochelatococcus lubricantis TaxID=1538102 RepID=A0ABX0UX64_9HYPH|nr:hypothetical protein [Pseudochelatococcus lubricantis]NIJ56998.1 hypothetical protein [Pseudochelatococcus lubricantis]